MKPPAWFIKSIGILDPLLSVRKSIVTSHWVIERTGYITASELATLIRRRDRTYRWITYPNEDQKKQIHQNRLQWQSLMDEVESAQHGKRIISRPRVLNQGVYDDLCKSDIRRYGGHARFSTKLEQEEERREADQERQADNRRRAFNGEVFDMMDFVYRKRANLLDHGEDKDLKYLLHGKRTQQGDEPIIRLTDF